MATNIGTLMAQLGLDTKGFKTALGDVDKDLKSFAKSMSTMAKEAKQGWEDMRSGFTTVSTAVKEVKTSVAATTAAIEVQTKVITAGSSALKTMKTDLAAIREVQKTQIQYQHLSNAALEKGATQWSKQTVHLSAVRTALGALDTRLGTTNSLLNNLSTSVLATNSVIREQAKALTTLTQQHLQTQHATNQTVNTTNRLTAANKQHHASTHQVITAYRDLRTVMLSLGSGAGIGMVTKSLIDATTSMEALKRGFFAATGSVDQANEMMTWLRGTTSRLGLEFYSIAERMKAFTAAAQGTTLEGVGVKNIFLGVLEASRAMGLDIDRTRLSLLALEQMMSKGTVQTEELRRQLGEHLPGAFRLAAEAMGKGTRELNQMLKRGEVFADELLPRLAKLLHEKFALAAKDAAHIAQSEIARLQTAFMDFKIALASGEFIAVVTKKIEELVNYIKTNEDVLVGTFETLVNFTEGFLDLAGSLVKVAEGFMDIVTAAGSLPMDRLAQIAGLAGLGYLGGKAGGALGGGFGSLQRTLSGAGRTVGTGIGSVMTLPAGAVGSTAGAAAGGALLAGMSPAALVGLVTTVVALATPLVLDKLEEITEGLQEGGTDFDLYIEENVRGPMQSFGEAIQNGADFINNIFHFTLGTFKKLQEYDPMTGKGGDSPFPEGGFGNFVEKRDMELYQKRVESLYTHAVQLFGTVMAEKLKIPKEDTERYERTVQVYGREQVKDLNLNFDGSDEQFYALWNSLKKLADEFAFTNDTMKLTRAQLEELSKYGKEGIDTFTAYQEVLKAFQKQLNTVKPDALLEASVRSALKPEQDKMIADIKNTQAFMRKSFEAENLPPEVFAQKVQHLETIVDEQILHIDDSFDKIVEKEIQSIMTLVKKFESPMNEFSESMERIALAKQAGMDFGAEEAQNTTFESWVKAVDTGEEYGEVLTWLQTQTQNLNNANKEAAHSQEQLALMYGIAKEALDKYNAELEKQERLRQIAIEQKIASDYGAEVMTQADFDELSRGDFSDMTAARLKVEAQLQKELIKLKGDSVDKQLAIQAQLTEDAQRVNADTTLIAEVESARRIKIAQDEAEATYKVLSAGITDFVGNLTGAGKDLVGWWEDLWERMIGIFLKAVTEIVIAWAVGMKDMSKLSASTQLLGGMFGLSGFNPVQTASGLSGITSAAQNSTGIFSIPGISQIGTTLFGSAMSPAMSALNPALDMSTLMALEASGAIAPGSAVTTVGAYSTLSPMPPSFMSFAPYGAAGGFGYSMLADPFGLPTGLGPNIGAGVGSMAGAYGTSALVSAIGMELGATMLSIVPVIGTVIGAVLGGFIGDLFGGSDHTQRRADRGMDWLASYTGIMGSEDLTSLAALPGLMLSPEFDQPYVGTIGDITRRQENEGSGAALKYTGLKGQAPKSEWMATVATMPDLNIEVANSLNEVGLATMDTVDALNNYADEIQLTSQYMEDWEADAQAMGQAYVDYYAKLTHLTMESFLDQMLEGTLATNDFITALAELGTSFPDQATFIMNQMMEDMLGNLEATADELVGYRTAWQQANDVLQETTKWQATYDQGLAVLFSDVELTAEEVQNFVYMLDLTQKALAGDVDAIETMMAVGDDFSAWVGALATDFDLLSVNIEKARLQLVGFTDDQLQAATMATAFMNYERSQLTPSTAGGISAENPDSALTPLSPFDVARESMSAGGGVDWESFQWLIDWFMDPNLSAEEFAAVSTSIGIAQEDFLSFIMNVQAGMDEIEAQAAALRTSAREGIDSLRNNLLDDIRQATMTDQQFASFKLDEEYAGYIAQATEWSTIMNDPLTALFDLINRWYDVQKDIVEQTGMTAEEMQRAGEEWKDFVEGVQNQALSLLTTEANPQDAIERLGIAKEAITSVLGGQSIDTYLGGIEDPEARLEAAQHLQELITTYLGTGQEAYQRPSSEYQSVFNEVIQLLGDLESFGIDQASEYGVLVDSLAVLHNIDDGIRDLIDVFNGTGDGGTGTETGSGTGGGGGTGTGGGTGWADQPIDNPYAGSNSIGWATPGTGFGDVGLQMVFAGGPYYPGQPILPRNDWLDAIRTHKWPGGGDVPMYQYMTNDQLKDLGYGFGYGYGGMASAATGMYDVPYDMPVLVHKKEAILTVDDAEEWRNGGGLTINNYIYESKDPRTTRKMMEEVVVSSLRRGRGRSISQRNARVGGV